MADLDDELDTQPVIDEYHERIRNWPLLFSYLLLALVVGWVIVLSARSVYRHSHNNGQKAPPPKTAQSPAPPATSKASGSSGKSSSQNSNSSNNQSAVNSNLPNSGPGQVLGLFAASSIAAAGLHFIISLRRGAKTG